MKKTIPVLLGTLALLALFQNCQKSNPASADESSASTTQPNPSSTPNPSPAPGPSPAAQPPVRTSLVKCSGLEPFTFLNGTYQGQPVKVRAEIDIVRIDNKLFAAMKLNWMSQLDADLGERILADFPLRVTTMGVFDDYQGGSYLASVLGPNLSGVASFDLAVSRNMNPYPASLTMIPEGSAPLPSGFTPSFVSVNATCTPQ